MSKSYNPLDKKNLGFSVAEAMLNKDVVPLPPEPFNGAGIYAIYYIGDEFEPYKKLSKLNKDDLFKVPIYVGKAVPAGARKGGFGLDTDPGDVLYKRLKEHAKTIEQVGNIELQSFRCRYLVVDDIWIPLGENLLIEMFSPVWNRYLDGFGIHDPGSGRYKQQRSMWDTIHIGRHWAEQLPSNSKTPEDILKGLKAFFDKHLKENFFLELDK